MNKLASIQKIHSFRPHGNADSLVCAKVKGWPVVVCKGEFNEGDLVVFIEIDSIVPAANPYFAFMEKQKYRVWSARFRGEPSQGLVCPLSILGYSGINWLDQIQEGDDVTEQLGVTKYERPIDASMTGDAKGNFPLNLISITDEKSLLSYPEAIDEFRGNQCYITMKQDGSSLTILWYNGELKVCRARELQESDSIFWRVVKKYDLPRKLAEWNKNIALQGECIGPKANGNRLGLKEHDFNVFNVKELDSASYFNYGGIVATCEALGVPTVPLLKVFHGEKGFDWTIDQLQEYANSLKYPNGVPAEGIVLRTTQPKYSFALNKNLSVKIVNQGYK